MLNLKFYIFIWFMHNRNKNFQVLYIFQKFYYVQLRFYFLASSFIVLNQLIINFKASEYRVPQNNKEKLNVLWIRNFSYSVSFLNVFNIVSILYTFTSAIVDVLFHSMDFHSFFFMMLSSFGEVKFFKCIFAIGFNVK